MAYTKQNQRLDSALFSFGPDGEVLSIIAQVRFDVINDDDPTEVLASSRAVDLQPHITKGTIAEILAGALQPALDAEDQKRRDQAAEVSVSPTPTVSPTPPVGGRP